MIYNGGIYYRNHWYDPIDFHQVNFYHWKITYLTFGSSASFWYKNFVMHNSKTVKKIARDIKKTFVMYYILVLCFIVKLH